ncbi:MAG: M35 family metallo-endopeptidase [Bacteroidia bacterium]
MVNLRIINRRSTPLTEAEEQRIRNSFERALCQARDVSAAIDRIWNQDGRIRQRRQRRSDAWAAHGLFTTWFGTSTRHILIRRVRRRIHRIRRWLENARIAVILHDTGERHCDASTSAFAIIPRRPVRVHLCPRWFGYSDESRRASILIHELTHQLGFGHPEGSTTEAEALALAARNSRRARRSPENFERLYKEYCVLI